MTNAESGSERGASDEIFGRLADVVGPTHLSSAPADVDAFGGLAPVAVVWPGSPPEVAGVLRACSELGVAVGVAGSGTRVARHWPVKGERQRIALDTRRMTNILDVDEVSLTVVTQIGITLRHLEEALRRQGLTLGLFPAEVQASTLGGLLAAPPPIAQSPQVGALADTCIALSAAHADGSMVQTRVAPRRATGPDVARLYIGSRGGLGVITTATLRAQRLPELVQPLAFTFATLGAALPALRELLAQGVRPARLRLLDAEQAAAELGETGVRGGAACLAVLAGPGALVGAQHRLLDATLSRASGLELPQPVASRWWSRRGPAAAPSHEPSDGRPAAIAARCRFSRMAEAVAAVEEIRRRLAIAFWIDEFTPHGANLWLTHRSDGRGGHRRGEAASGPAAGPAAAAPLQRAGESKRPLAAAMLDAGLDPIGPEFPPLMEELRQKLDPRETLVVMES
jgi:FAD/FMN-containing dehydrogenase